MTVDSLPFPFVAAGCKTGDRGTMALVTEPLASLSLSLKYLFLSNPALLRPSRVDDGGITSGTRVISVGVRILVIVSSFLTLAESNTTQIYLQATLAHTSTRARNSRTHVESHSLPSR